VIVAMENAEAGSSKSDDVSLAAERAEAAGTAREDRWLE
jgi:hypothetical protein